MVKFFIQKNYFITAVFNSRNLVKRLLALITVILTTITISTNVFALELLNVSYDPTRELYKEYNQAFIQHWKKETGENIQIKASHGGSGKQARSVIDGLQADVVTLALAGDIDAINKNKQLISPDWQKKLANNSTPYTSTIVFLVRKGNPKNIKDWDDLVKSGVEVITPNPKTSGGARWNFLAAWAYARQHYGSEEKALEFVVEIFKNAPVLDTGARAATTSFVQRELGDVLLAWENEAHLALAEQSGSDFEIITPSLSILAEPSVAVVDAVVDKKGTRKQATAYLEYLYSDEAQNIIAKNFYRPTNQTILAKYSAQFPQLKLVTIGGEFGGWGKAQKQFFDDGGVFDKIYAVINK